MCYGLMRLMGNLGAASLNFETFEVTLNLAIDVDAFHAFLDDKDLEVADGIIADGQTMKSAVWEEDDEEIWAGSAPKMEVSYDATNGFLLLAQFTIDRKGECTLHRRSRWCRNPWRCPCHSHTSTRSPGRVSWDVGAACCCDLLSVSKVQ